MPDREMGRGIKAMVENNQLDEHTLDMLGIVFAKMVASIRDDAKRQRITKEIANFNIQKEAQEKQDQADLQKLDSMLNAF